MGTKAGLEGRGQLPENDGRIQARGRSSAPPGGGDIGWQDLRKSIVRGQKEGDEAKGAAQRPGELGETSAERSVQGKDRAEECARRVQGERSAARVRKKKERSEDKKAGEGGWAT
jgi:hypothetical protein